MKFISWNVNGLRACHGKGFEEAFRALDADFFCLQETKMQEGQLDLAFEGYRSYWNYAEKKGYSGTAIFTRHEPLSVTYGIGMEGHDREGRVITLEMPGFYLVTVYTPNSQDELKRLDYRMEWEDAFREYLLRLDAQKPVIVCGDLNVAHQEIDLKNPKSNRRNAGFTDEEREKFQTLLDAGFIDTFRYFYPDQKEIYGCCLHDITVLCYCLPTPLWSTPAARKTSCRMFSTILSKRKFTRKSTRGHWQPTCSRALNMVA